ncbi:uncharacterized protein LOC107431757 [Ziziphus jujuba]|uniref:Uncharacterized protein LOC107431757 n=1 Tax=Ziziphus jujuba TaxID=326968 RepID=A0ABM3ZW19_ZIZJJ|nr:uncharacterized protein LOC107431757 [Ziziphus jujuba]
MDGKHIRGSTIDYSSCNDVIGGYYRDYSSCNANTCDVHISWRNQSVNQAEQFLQNNSTTDFMRFKRSVNGDSGNLQIAVVSYRKRFRWVLLRPFFQFDLVSTIPIADKELYFEIQKELESYDCVLYEQQMARILELDFQLDCPDYQADNWYHADLEFETFKLLQPASIREDLGPRRSKLFWASRVLPMPLVGHLIIRSVYADVGSPESEFPELEALSRLDFRAAMKVTADVEEESVIIGERNRAAIEALQRAIDDGHNRIAILYGAGHMLDLGRRLRDEFHLIPSRVQWVTAWSRNRDSNNSSFPLLNTTAKISGWPLNRYQTLALLIFPSVLALDLWFWESLCGSAFNWISQFVSEGSNYV